MDERQGSRPRREAISWQTSAAVALCAIPAVFWAVWGGAELFHESGTWYAGMVQYVLPWVPFALLGVVGLLWARLLAVVTVPLIGVAAFYVVHGYLRTGSLSLLVGFIVVGLAPLIAVTVLFWRGRGPAPAPSSVLGRILRPPRCRAALGVLALPTVTFVAIAAVNYVDWAQRSDDGYRGQRLIEGNGVTLVWAARGPGWPEHGGRSWNEIALFGLPPVGFEGKEAGTDGLCGTGRDRAEGWEEGCATQADLLVHNVCLYLNEDGTALLNEAAGIWRMPTTDELVRSLTRKGANAGCAWNGKTGRQECTGRPLRETPLWDPTTNYDGVYLFGEEASSTGAYYVYAEATVQVLQKYQQARSHNYRCVREP
ncbi:MAG: hypothetical protein FJ313_08405 [Gemmatimonadetes bacterium]|nr:hypothetical protein [Gemmatimonadota bacterium]